MASKSKLLLKTPNVFEITEAYRRVLAWFFSKPNRDFTFNEVCRATNTSKTTAHTVINELFTANLIVKTELGKVWRLTANTESSHFIRQKIAFNLTLVYTTNLIDVILEKYPQARALILFGSYRKGDNIEGSDIDIAVEIPGAKRLTVETLGNCTMFGYQSNVTVNLHLFSRATIDLNVFSNIANGILLAGFLEVHP